MMVRCLTSSSRNSRAIRSERSIGGFDHGVNLSVTKGRPCFGIDARNATSRSTRSTILPRWSLRVAPNPFGTGCRDSPSPALRSRSSRLPFGQTESTWIIGWVPIGVLRRCRRCSSFFGSFNKWLPMPKSPIRSKASHVAQNHSPRYGRSINVSDPTGRLSLGSENWDRHGTVVSAGADGWPGRPVLRKPRTFAGRLINQSWSPINGRVAGAPRFAEAPDFRRTTHQSELVPNQRGLPLARGALATRGRALISLPASAPFGCQASESPKVRSAGPWPRWSGSDNWGLHPSRSRAASP
jgi:hypothetical protein